MFIIIKELIKDIYNNHNEEIEDNIYLEYIRENIRAYVHQNKDKIIITAINENTKRSIDLTAKKYYEVFNCYREIDKVIYKYPEKIVVVELNIKDRAPKIIGYARVSSKGQLENNSLEQQEQAILVKYPTAKVMFEQFTGITTDRPILNKIILHLHKGDTLVVTKLDRLARNVKEGITIIENLFNKGVSIHVLNIGLLENTTMGRFFLTTLLAVSEMERNIIVERTQAGKEIARTKSGFKEGRPKKFKEFNIKSALAQLRVNGGSKSYSEVVQDTGISKSTLIRENNRRNRYKGK